MAFVVEAEGNLQISLEQPWLWFYFYSIWWRIKKAKDQISINLWKKYTKSRLISINYRQINETNYLHDLSNGRHYRERKIRLNLARFTPVKAPR